MVEDNITHDNEWLSDKLKVKYSAAVTASQNKTLTTAEKTSIQGQLKNLLAEKKTPGKVKFK